MKLENPKITKILSLSKDEHMSVEISDVIAEQIKKEYNIETIEDVHLKAFFRDVLSDAVLNSSS